MLGGRSTNFIIALQNRLSYASQRRIKALLPGAKPHGAGATAFWQNELPLKKPTNSSASSRPPGRPEKAQGEARSHRGLHLPARTRAREDARRDRLDLVLIGVEKCRPLGSD